MGGVVGVVSGIISPYSTASAVGVYDIQSYGADPTGEKDSTAAIQKAMSAAGAGSRNQILVPPGTYLTDPFELDGYWISGFGPRSSILMANATSDDFVTNNQAATNELDTLFTGIGLDCTNVSGSGRGLVWGANPKGATAPTVIMYDINVINGYNSDGVGVDFSECSGALADCHIERMFVYQWNNSNGFLPGSDARYINVVVANSGLDGWYDDGASSFAAIGCKFYSNGVAEESNGNGMHIVGNSPGKAIIGCLFQDNNVHGLLLDSANAPGMGAYVAGAICDTNSRYATGAFGAVGLYYACDNYVGFTAIDRYVGDVNYQTYALDFTDDSVAGSSAGNILVCPAFYATGGSVDAWILNGNGSNNTLQLANSGGSQFPSYAASFTPDIPTGGNVVITLTGNITVNEPTNSWNGAPFSVMFLQDATGGRDVSWDSSFKFESAWSNIGNTAGKRSFAQFFYDGSYFVCMNPAVNVWF